MIVFCQISGWWIEYLCFMVLEIWHDFCDWSVSYFWMDIDIVFCSIIGTLLMCVLCRFHVYALLWYQIFFILRIEWLVSTFIGLVIKAWVCVSYRLLRSWENHQEDEIIVLGWLVYYKSLTSFILLWFEYLDVSCDRYFVFVSVMNGTLLFWYCDVDAPWDLDI
jgi:hypothetical protein